ncbi:hypothetical protein HQ560_03580, partial [bacterium]|nr:hypothetical protein [bacterium]
GRLCALNLRTGKVRTLLNDPKGGVRDPQMHYSGTKILFAYRRGGSHPFHLYEIGVDGKGLRQLTDGQDDDIEPTYCPDGGIVFCSSRCRRYVNCWYTRVASLYRCDGDGGAIRMLSSNNDHDNTPWVLPDGRILYMRWEYVDRSQVHFHHLWTMNADGTGQMVYYGNMHGGVAMLDAKGIPGTNRVLASFSPGHGRPEHTGPVTLLTPDQGPDVLATARKVTRESHWRDPYPITESCFLVASRNGLSVMDGQGKSELIYRLSPTEKHLECHEPRPLRGRPRERVMPDRVDLRETTARLVLMDIYRGRQMASVRRGSIKKLLVLQQAPKPINFSGGMEPLTIGGSFTIAQIVGTVPVEPDGSAYFEVPALKSVFVVALDEKGRAVKRMHSFAILQPGETTSCVGCHENRTDAPHMLPADVTAMRREPDKPTPFAGIPDIIDFPRDVQPVLDRHCVRCHNPDKTDGGFDFCGDKTPTYTVSYWSMQRNLTADGRNRTTSNYPPYAVGTGAAPLMKYIQPAHYKVKLTEKERATVRLWIDTSATFPGTYAALGCGTYPVYFPPKDQAEMRKRCGECHLRDYVDRSTRKKSKILRFGGGDRGGRGHIYNLSRPEKARLVRAMLAKEAGGLALKGKVMFKSTKDPLYQTLLLRLKEAQQRMLAGGRFDLPGFRPNPHYIREMQRYGILPKDLKPDVPLDPYAVDRKYFTSFDHTPKTTMR